MSYLISCYECFVFSSVIVCIISLSIEVPVCEPPNYPEGGYYGPKQDIYEAGDIIHYYCNKDTFISGNYFSRCLDTGEWIGNTPFCDSSIDYSVVNQTSTANPEEDNRAKVAKDGLRDTCSSTKVGNEEYWMELFTNPGELYRVLLFIPKGEISYEVLLLKKNGQTISCGSRKGRNDELVWQFHECPGPNNKDAIGVMIKSLSSSIPLQICEVVSHVLTSPTCMDPRLRIDNGRLLLSRKIATLVCEAGFTRSSDTRIECVRTGMWNRKSLYCIEKQWETGSRRVPLDIDP